jgi:hypothetical protein
MYDGVGLEFTVAVLEFRAKCRGSTKISSKDSFSIL